MLVLGFSGYERRMMSVIEEVALRELRAGRSELAIVWMHREPPTRLADPLPKTTQRLASKQLKHFQLRGCRRILAGVVPATNGHASED